MMKKIFLVCSAYLFVLFNGVFAADVKIQIANDSEIDLRVSFTLNYSDFNDDSELENKSLLKAHTKTKIISVNFYPDLFYQEQREQGGDFVFDIIKFSDIFDDTNTVSIWFKKMEGTGFTTMFYPNITHTGDIECSIEKTGSTQNPVLLFKIHKSVKQSQ